MQNNGDIRFVIDRNPQTVTLATTTLINRGWSAACPKRIDLTKLAATLVRQVACENSEKIKSVYMFSEKDPEDIREARSLLPDFHSVSFVSTSVGAIVDTLLSCNEPSILAVLGRSDVSGLESHRSFAKALASIGPAVQNSVLESFEKEASDYSEGIRQNAFAFGEKLIVQEKPGKFASLGLVDATVKLSSKKWRSLSSLRKKNKTSNLLLEAETGFGVGALVKTSASASTPTITRKVSTATINLVDGDVDFSSTDLIVQTAINWFKEKTSISFSELGQAFVLVPYLIEATHFSSLLSRHLSADKIQYPDLFWGWHPALTLVDFLVHSHGPSLFIDTTYFPRVDFIAVVDG